MFRMSCGVAVGWIFLVAGAGCVQASDFAKDAVLATFKLFHPKSTGTCFFVRCPGDDRRSCLITAEHILKQMPGDTATLVLRKQAEDGTWSRLDQPVKIRDGENELWTSLPDDDIGVLLLDDLSAPVNALPFDLIADEERLRSEELSTCSSVFVLAYPERFEANDAGFPVARQGIIADFPFVPTHPHRSYLIDYTTFGGDSGGPVFVKDRNGKALVIGMVVARFNHDERVKTVYEERLIQHPLGLGTALYPQTIRAAIERALAPDKAKPAKSDPEETVD